jgi:tetratricopeptide (TPR) repeat protein
MSSVEKPEAPQASPGALVNLIEQIGRIKGPIQLVAFAVAAAVVILLFVAGRANIASILSTGAIGVCVIVFAQLVPLCNQIKDENLKVKLIVWLFVLFLIAFIILVVVAIKSVSIDTVSLENRARSYLTEGNCADGYTAAAELAKVTPEWSEAYSYKGWASFCLGRPDEAARDFRLALDLDQKATGGQKLNRYAFNLAAALIKQDTAGFKLSGKTPHLDEAIKLLSRVEQFYIKQNTDDVETWINLGLAYLMNDDCENAARYAEKIKTARDKLDAARAIDNVCAVVRKSKPLEAVKQVAGELAWIFTEKKPPEKKYDYLIPAQIGYLKFKMLYSEARPSRFAQVCCKGPEP